MANNEDVNQANQGAPAADIPDLKKKEKERKKAGAGWGGVKPGGGAFSGATGGTVARAAASAAVGTGAGAAEAAGAGWLSSMLASLTATVLGKAILAAGVMAFLAGAGLFAYAMMHGGDLGTAMGDLGAISSSMKVHADGGDRTGYVASNGEIIFDPLKKAAQEAKKDEKPPEDKTAGEAAKPDQTADGANSKGDWNRPGLEHNMSGSKLSSSLGGGFGGHNVFAGGGNPAAPKFGDALGKMAIKGGQKGKLSGAGNKASARMIKGGKGQQVKSNKAFGQLKVAKGMSALGAGNTAAEGARSQSAGAFDGQVGSGNVEGGPSAPASPGAVTSPSSAGGGAPDVTAPNVDTPIPVGMDPNSTAMLAGIAAMAKKAGEMKKKAAELMMMGLALIVVGACLLPVWPYGTIIGAILIGIGGMLVGMSIMMSQMAEMMKGMADSMSQGLAQRTSDVKQNEINKYCIDKAYNGTDPKDCNPPDTGPLTKANNSSEDANVSAQDTQHTLMTTENGAVTPAR